MRFLFVTTLLVWTAVLNAQKAGNNTDFSSWFANHKGKGLKAGNLAPDIYLGTVTNSNKYRGKIKLSDIKADLIILDFWNTACTDCVAAFPKMEKLQEEFGDKIQIFLVDRTESQTEVDNFFSTGNRKIPSLPFISLSFDLSHPLWSLFPANFVPYHVWIDKKRIVKMVGSMYNTYPQKIQEALDGRPVTFLKDENTEPGFEKSKPYFTSFNKDEITPIGSFFTSFDPDYAPLWGGVAEGVSDTQGIRFTYVNTQALELVRRSTFQMLKKTSDSLIFQNIAKVWPFYLLYVNDTSAYTSDFVRWPTDKIFMNSRYCYEQLLPAGSVPELHKQYMLDDLNRYFGSRFGTSITAEKKKANCYVLKRISGNDKIKSTTENFSQVAFKSNGEDFIRYSRVQLKDAIITLLNSSGGAIQSNEKFLILDGTGYKDVDIILPKRISSFQQLKDYIKQYDLNFVKEGRDIDFIIIKEKNYTGKIE